MVNPQATKVWPYWKPGSLSDYSNLGIAFVIPCQKFACSLHISDESRLRLGYSPVIPCMFATSLHLYSPQVSLGFSWPNMSFRIRCIPNFFYGKEWSSILPASARLSVWQRYLSWLRLVFIKRNESYLIIYVLM